MAQGIRILLPNAPDVMARLNRYPARLSASLRDSMQRSLDVVYRKVMVNLTGAVLHVQTGRLRQSIQTEVAADNLGTIGTNVEYAAIHEYGGVTRPHPILPRGTALRFVNSRFIGPTRLTKRTASSGVTFAKRVMHPGSVIPPRPYMRPALESSREEITLIFKRGLASVLAGVS